MNMQIDRAKQTLMSVADVLGCGRPTKSTMDTSAWVSASQQIDRANELVASRNGMLGRGRPTMIRLMPESTMLASQHRAKPVMAPKEPLLGRGADHQTDDAHSVDVGPNLFARQKLADAQETDARGAAGPTTERLMPGTALSAPPSVPIPRARLGLDATINMRAGAERQRPSDIQSGNALGHPPFAGHIATDAQLRRARDSGGGLNVGDAHEPGAAAGPLPRASPPAISSVSMRAGAAPDHFLVDAQSAGVGGRP